MLGDEDLLVEVYGRLQRKSWAKWRDKVPHLLNLLEDDIPVSLSLLFYISHAPESYYSRGCTVGPRFSQSEFISHVGHIPESFYGRGCTTEPRPFSV